MDTEVRPCLRCGRPLPREHSGGNCPWCLFAGTLGEDSSLLGAESREGIGDYEGLEEIGRGGTSVVYRAHQVSISRWVALKMLLGTGVAHRDAYERLRVEAEAVGRLEHPHIVPLYGIGREAGTPFLVLRYFERGSLAEALRQTRYTPQQAARCMATAARAVHHAHQHGVIHRDLKPSNLLLDDTGAPHVADFGLARLVDQDNRLTLSHSVMGTPAYMAPEQANGSSHSVGTPADLHALGAILYEMLTGRPPFLANTAVETLRMVVESDPVNPRRLVPGLCPDLAAICLTCLEKDPNRRYASAAGLANDLDRWLRHEPISVRPISRTAQVAKWVRRRPVLAGLSAAFALALLGGVAATTWLWRRAAASERRTEELLYAANVNLAQADWRAGNTARFRGLLHEIRSQGEPGFEWYYWLKQLHQERQILYAHASVTKLAFAPDGGRLATAGSEGRLRLWEMPSGRELHVPLDSGDARSVESVEFSPDGRRLLSADGEGRAQLRETETGRLLFEVVTHAGVAVAAFAPDGHRFATAGWDGKVKAWEPGNSQPLFVGEGHHRRVKCLAYSRDGRVLFTGGEDDTLRLWDAESGRPLKVARRHAGDLNALAVSPDGTQLATAGYDRTLRLWNLPEVEERTVLSHKEFFVSHVTWSPDGRRVASSSIYNSYVPWVWDVPSGRPIYRLPAHETGVSAIAYSPVGSILVTGDQEGRVRVWDAPPTRREWWGDLGSECHWLPLPRGERALLLREGEHPQCFDTRTGRKLLHLPDADRSLAVSANEAQVAWITQDDGAVSVAEWSNLSRGRTHRARAPLRSKLVLAPGGDALVGFDSEGALVWEAAGERPQRVLRGARPPACFSPRGDRLATGGESGWKVWDTGTGALLEEWASQSMKSLQFAPDGRWIAASGNGATVTLHNGRGGLVRALGAGSSGAHSLVAWSPDSRRVAFGTTFGDAPITVWEAASGRRLLTLRGHTGAMTSICYAADGRRLLSSSEDGTIRLWDAERGWELLVLRCDLEGADWPTLATFTEDGMAIVGYFKNGVAQRWDRASATQVSGWEAAEAAHRARWRR